MTSNDNGGADDSALPFNSLEFVSEIKHEDAVKYERVFEQEGGMDFRGASVVSGAAIKAAIQAGIIKSPDNEVLTTKRGESRYYIGGVDVDKMDPAQVRTIGVHVIRYYRSMVEIDKKKLSGK